MTKPILSGFTPLNSILIHQYERYLPSAFDESLTILQKINKVIEQLNKIGELTNDVVVQWNTVMEWVLNDGLADEVSLMLEEWYENGKLADIINGSVFSDINAKITQSQADILKLQNKASHYADVKDLGAKGDGVSNDTIFLQNALNLATTNGSVFIYVPDGVYRINNHLKIYKNTRLLLSPNAVIQRAYTGNMLINGNDGDMYTAYNGHGNIIIEGGMFDCNASEFPNGMECVGLAKGDNITIRDVIFRDVYGSHVLDIAGCRNILIDRCRFEGFFDTVFSEEQEAIQLSEHSQVGFGYFGNFDVTPTYNVTIRDCWFGKSKTVNSRGFSVCIGHHSAAHNVFNHTFKILNNHFEDATIEAVRLMKFENVIVEGNTFTNCAMGVRITNVSSNGLASYNPDGTPSNTAQSGRRVIINNNLFVNIVNECIRQTGYGSENGLPRQQWLLITNNIMEHTDAAKGVTSAISLSWAKGVVIKGNVIKDHFQGISGTFIGNLNIADNVLKSFTEDGILIYTNDSAAITAGNRNFDVRIHDNSISDCGKNGISIQYGLRIFIHDNHIELVSQLTPNTYCGIYIASETSNGSIKSNYVRGDQADVGISVTGSCLHIQLCDNEANGVNANEVAGGTSWQGYYIHYNNVRYRVKINSSGVIYTEVE